MNNKCQRTRKWVRYEDGGQMFRFYFDINQNIRLLATFNQYMYFIMKMLNGSIIHGFGYLEGHKVRMVKLEKL